MASSGSAQNNFYTKYYLKLRWEQVSQSIPNNNTTIKAYLELYSNSYYNISSSQAKSVSLTINGSTYKGTANISTGGGVTKQLFTATHTVGHNGDGSKTVSISGTCGFNIKLYPPSGGGGTQINTVSVSTNATLNTIPRASSMKVNNASPQFGQSITFTITRASGGFTHTIQRSFNGGAWTNVATGVGTSYAFTVPNDWMSSITDRSSVPISYRCITYNGGTQIGISGTVGTTTYVPDSQAPTVSAFGVSEEGTGLGVYVQGKSKVKFACNATFKYGTSLNGWTIQMEGSNYNVQNGTTGYIKGSGNITLTALVSDKRGKMGRSTKTISVLPYSQPSASIKGFRANASGVQDDTNGTYVKVTMNSSITSLSGKNTTGAWLQAWNGTQWINLQSYTKVLSNETFLIPDASLDNQYKYRLAVSDKWSTVTSSELTISTAVVTMDFLKGGKGIAFGHVANQVGVSTNLPVFINRQPATSNQSMLIFPNCGKADHRTQFYGGSLTSETVLGAWDETRGLGIWRYYKDSYGDFYFVINPHLLTTHIWANGNFKFVTGNAERHIEHAFSTTYFYLGATNGNSGLYDTKQGGAFSFNKDTGTLFIRGGFQTSDSRFKDNIKPLDMSRYYNFYMSLKPKTFTMNDELQKKTHWGLIAQDVKEELIKYGLKDSSIMTSNPCDETDDKRKLALNYQELITMNLKMIQEHEKIVNNQQEVIDDLVIKINKMDTILNDTNKTISQMQETINQLSTNKLSVQQINNEGHALKGSNKYSLKNIKEWFKCKLLSNNY